VRSKARLKWPQHHCDQTQVMVSHDSSSETIIFGYYLHWTQQTMVRMGAVHIIGLGSRRRKSVKKNPKNGHPTEEVRAKEERVNKYVE
jgi:hypothetical protein